MDFKQRSSNSDKTVDETIEVFETYNYLFYKILTDLNRKFSKVAHVEKDLFERSTQALRDTFTGMAQVMKNQVNLSEMKMVEMQKNYRYLQE